MKSRRRQSVAQVALTLFPDIKALTPIEELLRSLKPIEKRKLALVITSIRWVYQEKGWARSPEMGGVPMMLSIARIMLSHLHRYLQIFDHTLAAIFDDRTKVVVGHAPIAEEINRLIDESEAGIL